MKKIKYFVFAILLILQSMGMFSQTFYETKFYDNTGNSYLGFMVYYSESYSYMRIAFNYNDTYYVANVDYTATTGVEDGVNYVLLYGENPYYVTEGVNMKYVPEHFIWVWSDDFTTEKPLYTVDPDFNTDNVYEVEYWKEIGLYDISVDYLRQFYYTNEQDYISFTDALNYQETNTSYDYSNYNYSENEEEPVMHLFIAANTDIGDIGTSCNIDKNTFISEFEGISSTLNIELMKYVVDGDNFTQSYFLSKLEQLQPKTNDIVVFLYTGHGFRWDDQDDSYPYLAFTTNSYMPIDKTTTLSLSAIYGNIVAKGARLNIVVNNSCNSSIGLNQMTTSTFLATMPNNNFSTENLNTLFMKSSGSVLANAASPDEYAWCNSANGGFFTQSFLQAFRQEISALNNETPDWNTMVSNAINYTREKTSSDACPNCEEQNGIMYSNIITE